MKHLNAILLALMLAAQFGVCHAAPAVAQVVSCNTATTSASFATCSITPTGSGHTIVAFGISGSTSSLTGASGSTNGSYTAGPGGYSFSGNRYTQGFYHQNCSASAETVTVSWSFSQGAYGIVLVELSGVATSGGSDGSHFNDQETPGTGANIVVTGTGTNTTAGAMMISIAYGAGVFPSVGTSPISFTSQLSASGSANLSGAIVVESAIISGSGSAVQATYGLATTTAVGSLMMMFDPAAATTAPTGGGLFLRNAPAPAKGLLAGNFGIN